MASPKGRGRREGGPSRGGRQSDAASTTERWNREALAAAWDELGSLSIEEAKASGHDLAGALVVGDRVPAFQFAPGRREVVAQVVAVLEGELQPHAILLWLTGSSGYLDGDRPVDAIDDRPDEVVAAARYQASLRWP